MIYLKNVQSLYFSKTTTKKIGDSYKCSSSSLCLHTLRDEVFYTAVSSIYSWHRHFIFIYFLLLFSHAFGWFEIMMHRGRWKNGKNFIQMRLIFLFNFISNNLDASFYGDDGRKNNCIKINQYLISKKKNPEISKKIYSIKKQFQWKIFNFINTFQVLIW